MFCFLEEDLINSLPISKQCTAEEGGMLLMLYRSKLKKYHTPYYSAESSENKLNTQNTLGVIPLNQTPCDKLSSEYESSPFPRPPGTNLIEKDDASNQDSKIAEKASESEAMLVEENPIVLRLQESLDFLVTQAEQLYYNCDYQKCSLLTENILKQDPYHSACLPIHISCQVELKQSNSKCKFISIP